MQNENISLKEKIRQTEDYFVRILKDFDLKQISIAWTGGKDSTSVLFLFKSFLKKKYPDKGNNIQVVNIDTGLKFKEIIEFRDRIAADWKLNLSICRPEIDLDRYPVAVDPISCCRDLKINPLKKYIEMKKIAVLITGIRQDEHLSRQQRLWIEWKKGPEYCQVNPILLWSEMDIWSLQIQNKIPYCCLYDQGFRSLGCKPCTVADYRSERKGRNQKKENSLSLLHSLGYF